VQQGFGTYGSLVQLHDAAGFVDQERCWEGEIAVTIEEISIEDVVDAGHL
jgi:hypothetical protein